MGGEGRGLNPILTVCRHASSSPSCISSASTCPPARSEWSQRASAARHGLESLLLSCVSSPPPLPLPTSGGVGEEEEERENRGRERKAEGGRQERQESREREREGEQRKGKGRGESRGREGEGRGGREEGGAHTVRNSLLFTAVPIHPVCTVSCQPSEES